MPRKYVGPNTITHLISLIKLDMETKINVDDISTDLTNGSKEKVVSEYQGKYLKDYIDSLGPDESGKINSAKESDHALKADAATNAEEAEHAITADSALSATYATTADSASNADNLGGIPASQYVVVGGDGKVPSDKLPSYVDDVIEGYYDGGIFYVDPDHEVRIEGEVGKIYLDLTVPNEPTSYRYGGSKYAAIVSSDLVQITNEEIDTMWSETT